MVDLVVCRCVGDRVWCRYRFNGYRYATEGGGAAECVDGEVVGEIIDALTGVLFGHR